MFNLRDYKLKQQKRDGEKANRKPRYRAVICASDGSRTDGSPWADENAKQVWHQRFGSGGIGRAWCKLIVPEVGLGVIVSPTDDGLGWEVVEADPFLRRTATDNRNYETISPDDLQVGGRLMLWVDTRQITPLATYETDGTLNINVTGGDYPYQGERKTFGGAVNQDLSGYVPGAGLTRYVGIYLDATNTLSFVSGSTVAIGATPPEPSWPDGAFQLSVVQLDYGQTAIVLANDIFDRRMLFSDENGGGSVWPLPGKVNIGATEYATLALAVAASTTNDTIRAGEGDISIAADLTIDDFKSLIGSGLATTYLLLDTNVDLAITDSEVQNIGIDVPGASSGQTITFTDSAVIDVSCAPDITIDGGYVYGGDFNNVTFANTPFLNFPRITGTVTGAFTGYYLDASGAIVPAVGGNIWPAPNKLMIGTTEYSTVAAAIAAAVSGDTILAGVGTFTCDDQTLPSGVNLVAADKDATIFESTTQLTTLTLGGANYVANVTIKNTVNSAPNSTALRINTDASEVVGCTIVATNAGAGTATGVLNDSASNHTNKLRLCLITADNYGAHATSSAQPKLYLIACDVYGATASIAASTNALLYVYATMIDGGNPSAPAGSIRGYFGNTDGVFRVRGTLPVLEIYETNPGVNPATNHWFLFFKTDGLYTRDDAGTVVKITPIAASETDAGIAEIATQAETDAGTDDARIVTPLKLATRAATETLSGLAELATQTETNTGTDDARIVTPLKLKTTPIDHLKVSKIYESDAGAAALSADATGYLSAAVQPLVYAYLNASVLNVTGDATTYTVILDTELADRNSNFNLATSVFTAPVTGKYLVSAGIALSGLLNTHVTGDLVIVTSNRTYTLFYGNVYALSSGGFLSMNATTQVDMDASDTLYITTRVQGGTKVVDVFGAAGFINTFLTIYLLP